MNYPVQQYVHKYSTKIDERRDGWTRLAIKMEGAFLTWWGGGVELSL